MCIMLSQLTGAEQNGKVLAKAAEEDGAPSPAVSLGPLGRRLAML